MAKSSGVAGVECCERVDYMEREAGVYRKGSVGLGEKE